MAVIVMRNNRDYKNFTTGNYYHIYNRGNEGLSIFRDNEDFRVFLFFLKEALHPEKITPTKGERHRRALLPAHAFTLAAWCLMPNHYHLLVKQNTDVSISKLIAKVCTSYSKFFNKKYQRIGHLFQDRCKAVLIKSDEQFQCILEYIHQNPFRADLVKSASLYKWSSQNQDL